MIDARLARSTVAGAVTGSRVGAILFTGLLLVGSPLPALANIAGFTAGGETWLWHLGGLLIVLPAALWGLLRPRGVNAITMPGFEVITHSEKRTYIPLEEKFQHMDFVAGVKTRGSLRLSANLNKVNLSQRRYGYLLEDKNFRNALLVNRRRVRRTLLREGDVLDLGDLTLLYRDNRAAPIVRRSSVTPPEGKVQIRFERVRGPVRKGQPMLVPDSHQGRIFYVTKNLVYLGRSENNDLIIKSRGVAYRHAKIERVGGRYKLIDLANSGNTFVNNRRVEQRVLKEGDDISIDNQRFKFQLTTAPIKAPAGFTASSLGDFQDTLAEEQQGDEDSPRAAEAQG